VVTATQVGRQLGVSFPTANHALATLVRAGVLREPGSRRNRIFVADEVIRVLEGRAAPSPHRQGPP
jgi:DNA-binding GntR family transcriptional regulator